MKIWFVFDKSDVGDDLYEGGVRGVYSSRSKANECAREIMSKYEITENNRREKEYYSEDEISWVWIYNDHQASWITVKKYYVE